MPDIFPLGRVEGKQVNSGFRAARPVQRSSLGRPSGHDPGNRADHMHHGVLPTSFLRGRSYRLAMEIRRGVRNRKGSLGQGRLVGLDVKGLPVKELKLDKIDFLLRLLRCELWALKKIVCRHNQLPSWGFLD